VSDVNTKVSAKSKMLDSIKEAELKGILKWPLIVAAVVVVLRVIVERAGAPSAVSNMLSIVALHTLLGPIYFGIRIGRANEPRPYLTLIKLIAIYALATRAMVLPTYWLARVFEWPESRFYGLWGPDVTPFVGFIAVPFATAAFWIGASIVIGGAIGAATFAIVRSMKL
jgi:hypothetical protein